ncbi:Alpha/Beta hydrolase protein [Zopfochytrium polystomum]|nr:Alpha/Beta hydrolase protein [Zopfochytrium polystomum]
MPSPPVYTYPPHIADLFLPSESFGATVAREAVPTRFGHSVLFRASPLPPEKTAVYDGDRDFSDTVLPAGWRLNDKRRPLPEAVRFQKNVKIKLRDGVTLLADVFTPADLGKEEKVPAILVWSPYGKTFRSVLDITKIPFTAGVNLSKLSGLEKFEGPDPAEWCPRRYAIVNIDPRGIFDSEGDVGSSIPGRDETVNDSYDVIDWIAAQSWCNGKVGTTGNSQLAMSQYFIAEGQNPHLAAIAPWEGLTDNFRHVNFRGGIPEILFPAFIAAKTIASRGKFEDSIATFYSPGQDALYRSYAKTKTAKPTKIKVPIYSTAALGSTIHLLGSIMAWKYADTPHKWIRIHGGQEWHDYYQQENVEDLAGFFDHFLKGIDNGWPERTPRVRYQLQPHGGDLSRHYFTAPVFPPPGVKDWQLHLSGDGRLVPAPAASGDDTSHVLAYNAEDSSAFVSWTYTHPSTASTPLEFAGIPRVKVHAAARSHTDFDLCFTVRKLSASGTVLDHFCYPLADLQDAAAHVGQRAPPAHELLPRSSLFRYVGPTGLIRASRRKVREPTDEEREISLDGFPFHPHDEDWPVEPGQVVEIVTGLWPMTMTVAPGEGLRLDIGPVNTNYQDVPVPIQVTRPNENKGETLIYFGGKYDSHFYLPLLQRAQ